MIVERKIIIFQLINFYINYCHEWWLNHFPCFFFLRLTCASSCFSMSDSEQTSFPESVSNGHGLFEGFSFRSWTIGSDIGIGSVIPCPSPCPTWCPTAGGTIRAVMTWMMEKSTAISVRISFHIANEWDRRWQTLTGAKDDVNRFLSEKVLMCDNASASKVSTSDILIKISGDKWSHYGPFEKQFTLLIGSVRIHFSPIVPDRTILELDRTYITLWTSVGAQTRCLSQFHGARSKKKKFN